MKRKIISLLLCALLVLSSMFVVGAEGLQFASPRGAIPSGGASGTTSTGLTWSLNDAGALTISGNGAMPDYSWDSTADWLAYKADITSVEIGNGVTSIGEFAFAICSGLTSVTIPDSVTSIGDRAFVGCEGLTTVTIPDSVTTIDQYAFCGCSSLTSVTIPEGVTTIGDYAFAYCSSLEEEVTIPSSVTSIGAYAFSGCTNLTDIYFSGSQTTVDGSSSTIPSTTTIHGFNPSGAYDYSVKYGKTFVELAPTNHIVTFNANGGSFANGTPAPQTKIYGEALTLTSEVPTRAGYAFMGWSPFPNVSFLKRTAPGSQYTNESATAVTLYAEWVMDLTTATGGEPFSVSNSDVEGYTSCKIGEDNGDANKTWIKQSAKWTNPGSTAELRIDYAYDNIYDFSSKDVIFVLDVSSSMQDNGKFSTMIETVARMTASILDPSLGNRVAYTAFGSDLVSSQDFSGSLSDCLSYLGSLSWTGDTNYDAGLAKTLEYLNNGTGDRDAMLIFFSDGEPNMGEVVNGIYGGGSATAIKAAGCDIAGVFLGDYNTSVQTQFEGICSSPDMIYNCNDASGLSAAMRSAFYSLVGLNRTFTVNLDTARFTTNATAPSGGSYGDSSVTINNNTITWDVTLLDPRQEYYITVPLNFVEGAEPLPRSSGRGAPNGPVDYYPTSLEGNSIAAVNDLIGNEQINTVDTPVLPLSSSESYSLRFVNASGASPLTYYTVDNLDEDDTFTLTNAPLPSNTANAADGIPVNGNKLFAGWFKTAAAAANLNPAYAYTHTITINDTADMADGDDDGIITLYAGWVNPGTVSVNNADPNKGSYGNSTLSGFNLEGIQIKSKDVLDEGVEASKWQNAAYDGMRFVTVYRNGLITELDNLYETNANPNYTAASDSDITYGYTMYAKDDIASLTTLKQGTPGSKDIDCTRSEGMNHKYFSNYRLSTVVVKYSDDSQLSKLVEARAYINYIDANGFARRGYNTYTGSTFAGGCRARFTDARDALTRIS